MNTKRETTERRGGRAAALGLGLATAAVCVLAPAARPPAQGGDIEGARNLLQQWVDTRRQLSKEKQDWALGRDLLQSRLDLVQGEITSMRAKIVEVEGSIAEAERKRAELDADKLARQSTADELAATALALEARTRKLLAQLPDPLQQKLRPITQSLPAESAQADKGKLGERFLTVVGILNEANKFAREIRTESEIRTLANGSTVEVTTVYVGLGQAYYSSGNGQAAGYGVPGASGWTWTEANEHQLEIARAIAILTKGADADFVNLPIKVQ